VAVLAGVCAWLVLGCGDDAQTESWTIEADGISVTVYANPYRFVLHDGEGREVLASVAAPRGDGYAPLAWTTGTVEWGTHIITKGQFMFSPAFDPWREELLAVESSADARHVDLVLAADAESSERLVVSHRVSGGALRVEASLEGGRARAMSASFATPETEGFLGFGERYNRTDQRGVTLYNWAEEGGIGTGEGMIASPQNPFPNGESMTYYPVPFFVSTHGYAFWLDSTWRSTFDMATHHGDAWRVWSLDPLLAFEIYLPSANDERLWPDQLVDRFTARTGRPMLPPAWAYGPRRRVSRGSMVDGVPEIQAMRDRDLAITAVDDAVHFLPAGSHVGIEAELAAWVEQAHGLGYKVNGYYNSLLGGAPDSPIRHEVERGLEQGWFLKDAAGQAGVVQLISGELLDVYQVDFTSPSATAWFHELLQWGPALGYDGFMWDFGEYVQVDMVAADGRRGEALHNDYPVLYDRAGHDGLEASPKAGDWLLFARAGYTGSSHWVPMAWAGDPAASFEDSDGLPSMVRAGVSAGISGVPNWGGDIGGFHCFQDGAAAADGELLARWIQQGALSPNMQDQSACAFANDGATKATLWSAPEALAAWDRYARLHTRLFPYLWALAQRATAAGTPIMRHVFFEHPDREDLRAVDDAYYLGAALLVAPIVDRGARSRTIVLPEGYYLDWSDELLLTGGVEVSLDAPLDKLPLLLRAGQLVPLLDPSIDTLAPEDLATVIGPSEVADVYDVVGLLSQGDDAAFTLADGGTLRASLDGPFAPPGLAVAPDEASLSVCVPGCYLVDTVSADLDRVRISHEGGSVEGGGLIVTADVDRRVRWDLYIVQ
jgi:alpha-glucosidase (family GH31 glycosyl hydrolase)